jgi:large subunit ribosomal protein L6e
MPKEARNEHLVPGVPELSRTKASALKQTWKKTKSVTPKAEPVVEVTAVKKATKSGGERTVLKVKPARYYPAEDVSKPKTVRKTQKKTKLRSAITPGTVLILVAGRFRGKRVVFLKQLDSGLLLVTGPFKVNGVPLRRVNQAYTIATSTKIDVGSVPDSFNDEYFKREKKTKKNADELALFGEDGKKKVKKLNDKRAADQKTVDAAILASINKDALLKSYLKSKFSLKNGEAPHLMKF